MDYGRFTSADVLALWALEAELRPLDTDSERRVKPLLSKLAQMIGAVNATACCIYVGDTGPHRTDFVICHGNVEPRHLEVDELTLPLPILIEDLAGRKFDTIVTGTEDPIAEGSKERNFAVFRSGKPHGLLVGHSIYSARLLSDHRRALCLALHRPLDARPFGTKEMAIVEVVQRIEGSRVAIADSDAYRHLNEHQRQVVDMLCDGLLEKEVAVRLGISVHSVHATVKTIYRAFGVNSRYELLAERFQRRRPVAMASDNGDAHAQANATGVQD